MTVESEEEEPDNIINCSSSSYERSFSEEEEKKSGSSEMGEYGKGGGKRGREQGRGERRYYGKGNGERVLVRVDSTESEDFEDESVMSLKATVNRLEEMTRSMTHPSDSSTDPLKMGDLQENRRMTLPAMLVTPYSGCSSSSSSSEDVTMVGTLPNRTGFRRRARRRKMNSRNSVPCAIPLIRPERPLSAGAKGGTLTITTLPRNLSRSTGNLLEESEDAVYQSPTNYLSRRDPLIAPRQNITQSVSPSPRRRSSLLVALSGMLSKSQSNLLDVGEEVLPIKVMTPLLCLFYCFSVLPSVLCVPYRSF